ncbi:MAG: hypothetical protein Q8S13_09505 [Dehalococcoidia bacterium]|nr:hypothetical protein [Dehalococcoidia bacterium]
MLQLLPGTLELAADLRGLIALSGPCNLAKSLQRVCGRGFGILP